MERYRRGEQKSLVWGYQVTWVPPRDEKRVVPGVLSCLRYLWEVLQPES